MCNPVNSHPETGKRIVLFLSASLLKKTVKLCLLLQVLGGLIPISSSVAVTMDKSPYQDELLSRPVQTYTLDVGETTAIIAERLGLTSDQLQTYNQRRTFRKPFHRLSVGDELDIPASGMKISSRTAIVAKNVARAVGHDDITPLIGRFSRLAGTIASGNAAVTGEVNSAVEQWLSQFGTVQTQLSVNDECHLDDSRIDWWVSQYETPKNRLFTQLGWRNKDDHNTLNRDMGMRWFTAESMYRANRFYDVGITGGHCRPGPEYWRDDMSASANSDVCLSDDWHQAMTLADDDERPVNDWLSASPKPVSKLLFGQYYANDVALFGTDTDPRQEKIRAVMADFNWTPFPLLTAGFGHSTGEGRQKETSVNMQLTWKPDASGDHRIPSAEVDATRRLSGNRHNPMDRNNDIVLEYRKQVLIKSHVGPSTIKGVPGSTYTVTVQVNSKYLLQRVDWDNAAFLAAGGRFRQTGMTLAQLTLPPYQMAQSLSPAAIPVSNFYVLTATAVDSNGNHATLQELTIEVLPPALGFRRDLTVAGNGVPADGKYPLTREVVGIFTVTATVNGSLPQAKVAFTGDSSKPDMMKPNNTRITKLTIHYDTEPYFSRWNSVSTLNI